MRILAFFAAAGLFAAENLQVNPRLNYSTDANDGALFIGRRLDEGARRGVPNYVLIYSRSCYNSKRQARRTAELYRKYRGRVHFVTIDIDSDRTQEQQNLVREYYLGYVPHVVILGAAGEAVYDRSGEAGQDILAKIIEKELTR